MTSGHRNRRSPGRAAGRLRNRPRLVPAAALLAALALQLGAEEIALEGGATITARVIQQNDETIFVDLGYTILGIPRLKVRSIQEAAGDGAGRNSTGESSGTQEAQESIYFTARLGPGSIQEKADQVSEGVVQVVCPRKLGSGFIINEREGFVVTNFHVIEGDQEISVVIYERRDKELYRAKLEKVRILAFNPFLDLALLKIEDRHPAGGASEKPVELKKVYLGSSREVSPGNPVFAIGSPLGLERTISEGIVSNQRRAMEGLLYIQTTAAINPGNSGGPLFNDRGEVIGITSLKVSFGEGLGFAIPVDELKNFLRNREAFAFEKDNDSTGIRYYDPPRKAAQAPAK